MKGDDAMNNNFIYYEPIEDESAREKKVSTPKKKIARGIIIAIIAWLLVNCMPRNITSLPDFPDFEQVSKIEIMECKTGNYESIYLTSEKTAIEEFYDYISSRYISRSRIIRTQFEYFTESSYKIKLYKNDGDAYILDIYGNQMKAQVKLTIEGFYIWGDELSKYLDEF